MTRTNDDPEPLDDGVINPLEDIFGTFSLSRAVDEACIAMQVLSLGRLTDL